MRHTLAGAALNVSANFFAVPVAGIEGAAVVTVASILLIISLNYRSCLRLGYAPPLAVLLSGRAPAAAGAAR
jgi:O-antigen/teichoic acid export membrane protein